MRTRHRPQDRPRADVQSRRALALITPVMMPDSPHTSAPMGMQGRALALRTPVKMPQAPVLRNTCHGPADASDAVTQTDDRAPAVREALSAAVVLALLAALRRCAYPLPLSLSSPPADRDASAPGSTLLASGCTCAALPSACSARHSRHLPSFLAVPAASPAIGGHSIPRTSERCQVEPEPLPKTEQTVTGHPRSLSS